MNSVLSVQVSLFTVLKLPIIPSPATCCRPRSLVWFSLRSLPRGTVFKPSTSRKGLVASWASPFSSWLATTTGRIEFVILRTDRSPPDALHPASRRRSFVRLQCSNPTLTGTHTPPFQHHHKRTSLTSPVGDVSPCGVRTGTPIFSLHWPWKLFFHISRTVDFHAGG